MGIYPNLLSVIYYTHLSTNNDSGTSYSKEKTVRIGIVGKTDNIGISDLAGLLIDTFKSRNIEIILDDKLSKLVPHDMYAPIEKLLKKVNLVMVLGGDGTFLGVSRMIGGTNIPIVGINMGGLGFLTEVTKDEAADLAELIINRKYEIENRAMISVSVLRKKKILCRHDVLNDVVINRGIGSRIVDLSINIDGSQITAFKADGLIIATPTGSTAYSLSAGGPIVFPTLPLMIVTPICPHTLTNRPLVISNTRVIHIKSFHETKGLQVTLDGQINVDLKNGDVVKVTKSKKSVNFIKSPFRDYFTILKTKLMWGERYGTI